MQNSLENALDKLVQELNASGKQEVANYFISLRQQVNTDNIADLSKTLEQLMSLGTIVQYADFSYKQEVMLEDVYEAAKLLKNSI